MRSQQRAALGDRALLLADDDHRVYARALAQLGAPARDAALGEALRHAARVPLEIAETVAGYTSYGLRATKEVMWANLDAPSLPAALALENRNQEMGAAHPEVVAYMAEYSKVVRKS